RVTSRAGERLRNDLGRHLARFERVGDALAVARVHHAAGVADEQHATAVVRLAVEAHGQSGAADRTACLLLVEAPLLRHLRDPALEQFAVVDVAERRRGVEDADAYVARTVAHA